eukprot:1161696-Pelagomonas_calceolata.AAC.13
MHPQKPSGGKDWAPVWPGFPVPGSVGGLQDVPVRYQKNKRRAAKSAGECFDRWQEVTQRSQLKAHDVPWMNVPGPPAAAAHAVLSARPVLLPALHSQGPEIQGWHKQGCGFPGDGPHKQVGAGGSVRGVGLRIPLQGSIHTAHLHAVCSLFWSTFKLLAIVAFPVICAEHWEDARACSKKAGACDCVRVLPSHHVHSQNPWAALSSVIIPQSFGTLSAQRKQVSCLA